MHETWHTFRTNKFFSKKFYIRRTEKEFLKENGILGPAGKLISLIVFDIVERNKCYLKEERFLFFIEFYIFLNFSKSYLKKQNVYF